MADATTEIDSVAAYVDAMSRLMAPDNDLRHTLWFRGHGDASWKLLPGVLRDAFVKRIKQFVIEPADSAQVKHATETAERIINNEFRVEGASLLPARAEPIDIYFAAQHHGLPTRLLDWTQNPLAALFFAVNESAGPWRGLECRRTTWHRLFPSSTIGRAANGCRRLSRCRMEFESQTAQNAKILRRQAWMRDQLIEQGQRELDYVGSIKQSQNVVSVAARIKARLGLTSDWSERQATWEDALRTLRATAERIGILVAANSVVGLNSHRPLDPDEFRGFVLCDPYAPLVFINSADSKSAQMFTLVHELAHIWLGRDALFNLVMTMPHRESSERFCNQVAAEFLVPEHALPQRWKETRDREKPFHALARVYKVSPLVVARRALDLGLISRAEFFHFYRQDQADRQRRKTEEKKKAGGPNFYLVQDARLGKRFAYEVVRATREGRLLHRDAYQLTDLRGETFDRYADRLIQRVKDERR